MKKNEIRKISFDIKNIEFEKNKVIENKNNLNEYINNESNKSKKISKNIFSTSAVTGFILLPIGHLISIPINTINCLLMGIILIGGSLIYLNNTSYENKEKKSLKKLEILNTMISEYENESKEKKQLLENLLKDINEEKTIENISISNEMNDNYKLENESNISLKRTK